MYLIFNRTEEKQLPSLFSLELRSSNIWCVSQAVDKKNVANFTFEHMFNIEYLKEQFEEAG